MTDRYTTHAFIAGELAPEFYARTDLDKYALGVSLARNFLIDFRGGLKSAPGTAFVAEVDGPGRITAFPLAESVAEVLLYFGALELIIRDPDGDEIFVTPYAAADLSRLHFDYKDFRLVISHPDYAQREVTWTAGTWAFAAISYATALAAPTGFTVATFKDGPGALGGAAKTIFTVTALDADGNESVGSIPVVSTGLFNYAAEAGNGQTSWTRVAEAASYRIYRGPILEGAQLTRDQQTGYIGASVAPAFVDVNVSPDYTQQPPLRFNPFAAGTILRFNITAGGSGYTEASVVTVSGGTGFVGYPLVYSGALVGIVVVNGGAGYTTGSTVSISIGTSATAAVAEASPASGLFPSCSTVLQQRRLFAGPTASPLTIFGSKIGAEQNFDYSNVPNAADAFVFPVDTASASPITHMEEIQGTLLIFHTNGVEALRASEGAGISAVNFAFRNQTNQGASAVTPAQIGNDIIYASAHGTQIIALGYTYYTNSFQEQDVSVLAPHLFGGCLAPVRMVWQREPDKLLWVLRKDGTCAVLTYMKDQEIYAWAQRTTDGIIHDLCLLRTPDYDYVYWLVERTNGFFIEEVQQRVADPADEYWGVDCGVRYEGDRFEHSLQIYPSGEDILASCSTAVFAGTVGKLLRAGGGLYEILSIVTGTSNQVARVSEHRAATRKGDGKTICGSWTISTPIDTVTGLEHLEGQTVAILADGDALPEMVVDTGELTFEQSYSQILVGLPITCEASTLPLANMQVQSDGKKKRVVGSAVRLFETRGLEIGSKTLFEVKPSVPTIWGEATPLISEPYKVLHESLWEIDTVIRFRQRYPLPASVLGYVTELEAED